jgi:hypothetical protein
MVNAEAARLLEVLERMERTVASRVGAGRSVDEAWSTERWRRELVRELVVADVEELLARIRRNLAAARTARDVHEVFGRMRGRLAGVPAGR